jgi:hypothetical protein
VDEAFIEKDWHVVQAMGPLVALGPPLMTPIFSGGTSLLKAHRLINRFSEDIDFKLALSPQFEALTGNQKRRSLSDFRDRLTAQWKEAGFSIEEVMTRNAGAFIRITMSYPSEYDAHASLRPHILAEISAKPPALPPTERPISSFVAEYLGEPPELAAVPCIDPVETAADKLSALAWRVIARIDRPKATMRPSSAISTTLPPSPRPSLPPGQRSPCSALRSSTPIPTGEAARSRTCCRRTGSLA